MSVWSKALPAPSPLSGSEGELVSVSIATEPCYLESLLETLAKVSFPVNPQIYHDALLVTLFPDQHEESAATTLVEFPAWASRLDEVRQALSSAGFDPASVHVTSMIEEIHAGDAVERGKEPGVRRVLRKRAAAEAARAGKQLPH